MSTIFDRLKALEQSKNPTSAPLSEKSQQPNTIKQRDRKQSREKRLLKHSPLRKALSVAAILVLAASASLIINSFIGRSRPVPEPRLVKNVQPPKTEKIESPSIDTAESNAQNNVVVAYSEATFPEKSLSIDEEEAVEQAVVQETDDVVEPRPEPVETVETITAAEDQANKEILSRLRQLPYSYIGVRESSLGLLAGKTIHVGQQIKNLTIDKIQPDSVVFRCKNKTYRVIWPRQ